MLCKRIYTNKCTHHQSDGMQSYTYLALLHTLKGPCHIIHILVVSRATWTQFSGTLDYDHRFDAPMCNTYEIPCEFHTLMCPVNQHICKIVELNWDNWGKDRSQKTTKQVSTDANTSSGLYLARHRKLWHLRLMDPLHHQDCLFAHHPLFLLHCKWNISASINLNDHNWVLKDVLPILQQHVPQLTKRRTHMSGDQKPRPILAF